MNNITIVLTVVIFVLAGTLAFASLAPLLIDQTVNGARPTTLPPCNDDNTHNDNVCRARPPPGPR